MPHMVVFRTKEGKQGYHLADTLDDAVRFVEHLRNNEQVADSKVYRMHEVPIEFKVLYKVEVAGTPGAGPTTSDETRPRESGRGTDTRTHEPGRGADTAPAPAGGGSIPASGGEDRNDSVRGQSGAGGTSSVAQTPADAETGGRFGLFSRA
ncbi:MAG: hypothetical protein KY395_02835 [Actinobacteria bacterium]|nr:hypothetical protein [Actinomycetota bacterium]